MDILLWMKVWCLAFALFVAVTAFSQQPYPDNVRRWTGGSNSLVNLLSTLTIVVASISLFETYKSDFGGGGGGGGGY